MRQLTIFDTTERICAKYDAPSIARKGTETELDNVRGLVAALTFFAIFIAVCCMYILIRRHL
jgi:hypothetical protein